MKTILFVCTGNVCRSPMAEGMMRHMLHGDKEFEIMSAGLGALRGLPPSEYAIRALREIDIDISGIRSQPVTKELLHKADAIFVMTRSHRQSLISMDPSATSKTFLLQRGEEGVPMVEREVPDPIGQSYFTYLDCRDTIRAALPSVLKFMKKQMDSLAPGFERQESSQETSAKDLREIDPAIFEAIEGEKRRQQENLELIASENFAGRAVLEAQGSVLTNKYAEGYPGKRYYGGCEFVDVVESIAIERAQHLFGAEHANVQPHSGSQANMAVYFSVLKPGDKILTMELAHGGHLTHGFSRNFSGQFYQVVHYGVRREDEQIDYDAAARLAEEHHPKLITVGASAYSRMIDFKRMREIADSVGALLFVDMAHIAGLVAAGIHPSPVPYADFVTTTTHKTLRGPRGGLILCRERFAKEIDAMVLPGIQGGPLMHVIAAKAVCFLEALQPSFRLYQHQIVKNARALAEALQKNGCRIVSGGTDNHLMLVDLRAQKVTGKEAQIALDQAGITVNKNLIPFDPEKPHIASGIRLGTPAVTSRGMKEEEMHQIANLISTVLVSIEDETILAEVKEKVRRLNQQFPLPY